MSYISALTGIGSGAENSGYNFKAGHANIVDPVTGQQVQQGYDNAQQGLGQQQAFINALAGQNGIQNQSDVYNQYKQIANGTGGPNPAQNMLNQATSANVANQAALMAGQRGASANVGLIGRQAAMQGANIQQQAAGQAATLGAQQQQQALGQMAGLSTQQVGQQAGAIGNYNQFAQNEQNQLLNAQGQFNNAAVGSVNGQNNANAMLQGKVAEGQQALIGGAAKGAGAATGMAHGGEVQPKSHAGQFLRAGAPMNMGENFAHGGKVPAMVSPGEVYIPPSKVKEVAVDKKNPKEVGQVIPGKAKVKGDSLRNDTVPKELEEGGFVIPKSIMEGKDVAKNAAAFVAAHLAKKGQMPMQSKKAKK